MSSSTNTQNNETDKIAIIAATCASAIWVYDQIKISDGVNWAMILCIVFIISGFLYLAMVGLMLSIQNKSSVRFLIGLKAQKALFSFTIKYFWYVSLYVGYQLIMGLFNISFATANQILTIITIIFGILAVASLFPKPRALLDKFLRKIYRKLKNN